MMPLSAQIALRGTTAKLEVSLQSQILVMKVSTAQLASQSLEMMHINAHLATTAPKDHLKRLSVKLVHISTNTIRKLALYAQLDIIAWLV
jgi:hypothetical protein